MRVNHPSRERASTHLAARQARTSEAILQAVVDLIESEGFDAVQVRSVAKRARVSLTTLYKLFPTLDGLIVAAMARWMESHSYSGLTDPQPDTSLYEGLMGVYRQIFEPWKRSPRMLAAYYRATSLPGGEQLDIQTMAAVERVARSLFDRVDPAYAQDVVLTMTNLICGLVQQVAGGALAVSDILPVIERTLFRLTTDNAALATAGWSSGRPRRSGRRRTAPSSARGG